MLQRLANKKVLLLSALMASGLVRAEETLPDVVKHFSEQQDIKIIKKIDAPGGAPAWLGKYQDMGVTLFLTPDGKHVVSGYLYDEPTSAKPFSRKRSTPRWAARCGKSSMPRIR